MQDFNLKIFVYYNERYNSIWFCFKEHTKKGLEDMYVFFKVRRNGDAYNIHFLNPNYFNEWHMVELGEL